MSRDEVRKYWSLIEKTSLITDNEGNFFAKCGWCNSYGKDLQILRIQVFDAELQDEETIERAANPFEEQIRVLCNNCEGEVGYA